MGSARGADDHLPRRCFGRFTLEDQDQTPPSDDWLFRNPSDLGAYPRRAAWAPPAAAPTPRVRRPPGLRGAAAASRSAEAGTPAGGTGGASTSSSSPGGGTGASTSATS
ncbi:unnamed protein product [Prorocentrum cordatum]|uniref:Uncharacterized protein n=1 Tax=Prorocentrum cordatum TaxID=2364126 RepID=A0ABN9Q609_9DINO|nr:unnamed protein product [Polarella glacialis]